MKKSLCITLSLIGIFSLIHPWLLAAPQTNQPAESEKGQSVGYPIIDTNQKLFFDEERTIHPPAIGDPFYGQDASFSGLTPSYTALDNGRVRDNHTGLTWERKYRVMTQQDALKELERINQSSPGDWRLPSIKEAYSLIDFSGKDPSGPPPFRTDGARPFINTDFFDFQYGANGNRPIDAQMLTSTIYRGRTMGHNRTVFGVNFADGRIKGYPIVHPRGKMKFMVRFVRGNKEYGKNVFQKNEDGTITDRATGLMWSQRDSGTGMTWKQALLYAQEMNQKNYLGYSDWRLPDAKELHSIVDYTRSPQMDESAAISPIFQISTIQGEDGKIRWPGFWTSTTHQNIRNGRSAVYISFGEALGYFAPPHSGRPPRLMDVHGAGAQRSDPKQGNARDYPRGQGPQGDVIRINNYVRLVRNVDT